MCGTWEMIAGDVRCVGHLGNKLMALSTVSLCFTSLHLLFHCLGLYLLRAVTEFT